MRSTTVFVLFHIWAASVVLAIPAYVKNDVHKPQFPAQRGTAGLPLELTATEFAAIEDSRLEGQKKALNEIQNKQKERKDEEQHNAEENASKHNEDHEHLREQQNEFEGHRKEEIKKEEESLKNGS